MSSPKGSKHHTDHTAIPHIGFAISRSLASLWTRRRVSGLGTATMSPVQHQVNTGKQMPVRHPSPAIRLRMGTRSLVRLRQKRSHHTAFDPGNRTTLRNT